MSGVNLVILMGRLTSDPEIKNIKGLDIANFSIVTSKQWKDESGEKHEKVEYHNIVAFKKTAEIIGKYFTKGKPIHIVGELQTRSWDDEKSGTKKYKTEIVANRIEFVGDKQKTDGQQSLGEQEFPPEPPVDTNEIPF